VDGDPARLHQIITNVLTNAQKFTPPGGSIHVELTKTDTIAIVRVTDTGIGIPDEDQALIFDRFWRGRDSEQVPGTGVGLAVVAELVRAHHGSVAVDSKVGRGTTMSLEFPRAGAHVG
jgi:signal transduction histidine kinase